MLIRYRRLLRTALKAEGWRVLATARTDADHCRTCSDGIEAFQLDYRDATSIAALFETVMAATGGTLDAVFNNGAYSQPGAVEDLPVEALREQFEANVFGWHDLTRRIVPVMRAQGHGRIVQCSSILGLVRCPIAARTMPRNMRSRRSASPCAWNEGLRHPCQPDRAGPD